MSKTNSKLIHILIWILLISAVCCVVSAIISLSTMGVMYGEAPGFGDIYVYLFQTNATLSLVAAIFCGLVLFGHIPHVTATKVVCWAALLLCVMTLAPFITDTITYLGDMSFVAGFRRVCAFLPFMSLVAILMVLLTTWERPVHLALRNTSFIASLISVFACVVYLWQVFPSLAQSETLFDASLFLGIIFGMLTATLFSVCVWAISSTDELFASTFYRYDDEMAQAYVEARTMQVTKLPLEIQNVAETQRLRKEAIAAAVAASQSGESHPPLSEAEEILEIARAASGEGPIRSYETDETVDYETDTYESANPDEQDSRGEDEDDDPNEPRSRSARYHESEQQDVDGREPTASRSGKRRLNVSPQSDAGSNERTEESKENS